MATPTTKRSLLSALTSSLLLAHTQATPWKVLDVDFPDPAIIHTDDGYHAFATTSGDINTQVAHSADFTTWTLLEGHDALPAPFPDWVIDDPKPGVWAPDVIQRDDGTFIMYYCAYARQDPTKHCVGAATSPSVEGPYTPEANVLACPTEQGGAIDASGYKDDDGTWYVVYKVDGSALNTDANYHPTPIMLQKMEADAVTPVGEPVQLIDRGEADGPLVEAPSITRGADGVYYMGFSSNMFDTLYYDMSWATAEAIAGPWTKSQDPGAPLLVTGDDSDAGPLGGPGGADFRDDGKAILFHAFNNGQNTSEGRGTWAAEISLEGGRITLL
ncbi:hypothetical protein FE257_011775 [Aspergillus nanangensis]|uniref:Uncharacterized protein n=1 Tax=Aspergillus nanangensis TaxID=2582783 RepID=A0AAD4CWZ9_ASPNN|nr:hypothetical protein FE257_011775 [Aspergillus nanangensis]